MSEQGRSVSRKNENKNKFLSKTRTKVAAIGDEHFSSYKRIYGTRNETFLAKEMNIRHVPS